ncbi:ribokinase [Intrasporangium sp.]|uniref:ribokinase n=1 Tax=Intrasporangium sp. TaxID=1925024 RepID=UPI0029397C21|nr:ribokinase [Intrasporangium sp.]MDV3220856.1 ribokinase [Intrasporangium sp.]
MSSGRARVAVVGSYGVGLTMRLPRVPIAGETISGGTFSSGHGGKGSNQAVGAARLGADVSLLTAVGDDAMGAAARTLWTTEGIDAAETVAIPGVATMVGMILVEPSGENRIVIATGALDDLSPGHVESFRGHLAAADIAVVSLEIPVETAVAALRTAHEAGTTTLLNPAPARRLPEDVWEHIDVLTPNRTEAAVLLGHDPDAQETAADLAAELHRKGVGSVVVTLGAHGALIHDAEGRRDVPAVAPREVVDTTGAGDSFTAALAVALAEGQRIDAAAGWAAHAGAHTVSVAEVVPALPHRADLAALTELTELSSRTTPADAHAHGHPAPEPG